MLILYGSHAFCGVVSSGPVQLGAWPGGSWLPRWAAPLVVVCCWSVDVEVTSIDDGPLYVVSPFHLHNGLRPN